MKWLKQLTEKQVVALGAITLNVLILLLYKREPQNALWLIPVALLGLYLVLFQFEWLFRILLFILPFSLNLLKSITAAVCILLYQKFQEPLLDLLRFPSVI